LIARQRFTSIKRVKKPLLYTPGPTPLPDRVRERLAQVIPHHRSSDFEKLFSFCRQGLKALFGTKQEVITLAGSGTMGLDACIQSLMTPEDRVLVINAGKFGERFTEMCQHYRVNVEELKLPWGTAATRENLAQALKPHHSVLCVQHSETSTGVLHPIKDLAEEARSINPEILIVVDGITSIGACAFEMDRWQIDAAVCASQKALMLPPGLAFVSLSSRAEERLANPQTFKSYSLNLGQELRLQKKNQTAFTPAIQLIAGLETSLQMIFEEGLHRVFERHHRLSLGCRAALPLLGFHLANESVGPACTPVFFPEKVSVADFLQSIKRSYGFEIAGAQGEWAGRVMRISHLGAYTPFDLLNVIAACGRELERRKQASQTEEALGAFMKAYDL
jgi:aspartate aminotransferase-like enzyme